MEPKPVEKAPVTNKIEEPIVKEAPKVFDDKVAGDKIDASDNQ